MSPSAERESTRYETQGPEETIACGHALARQFAPAELVLLRGELGAGKTTLVKGIAEGLGAAARDEVTSPTFTLIHEYRGPDITIYHVDLYRIEGERELGTLGLDELIHSPGSLVLVEWGEKFPELARERNWEVVLERSGESRRTITVAPRPKSRTRR